ncbi:glycosyl transferase family 90 [Carboxylicivirga caseinilyticus]|uniref:glycosyl transferase family 90 n=1 Tax=Carboxylicivirga caseinilyticus TaxID=3417572 RepID=UPI003D34DFD5|nr:lipopolysaccharide biosynthesis protein [Marinilabiliaceae bacterium A049]
MNKITQILPLRTRKNNKFKYYASNFIRLYINKFLPQRRLETQLKSISSFDEAYILERVNYYNKIQDYTPLSKGIQLNDFLYTGRLKTYFFDTVEYTRFFNKDLKFNYLFGDITEIPSEPSIVKSRPIVESNENSVLLNLNRIRHFNFIYDRKHFADKKDRLVWRGYIKNGLVNRISFMEKFINHSMCDVGQVKGRNIDSSWFKEKLSIQEQLEYKFIMSLEGNDVATNLKWIMSSNSVAVMPKPKFETWFMEGKLLPDYHYIHVEDDYSNLEEKLNYYMLNPDKAIGIVKNANAFVKQFQNKKQEDLISLMVLQKYFDKTNAGYSI